MQKGSAPVVGAALLILISVTIAVLYFMWVYDYTAGYVSKSEQVGSKQIKCNDAGITILSCDYNADNGKIKLAIKNSGAVDLNGFRVVILYEDYTSDANDNKNLYIESGLTGIAYATANTSKTIEKVSVIPLECSGIIEDSIACG